MTTGYVWHEAFGWYDTGTGPDLPSDPAAGLQPGQHFAHPDTKRRVHELIAVSGLLDSLVRIGSRLATDEELLRVHTRRHLDSMIAQSAQPKGGDTGDGISPFGKGGIDIARRSAGGAIALVDAVVTGKVDNGYALINPAGHHARPDQGMGFCMFNNVAVAARYAQDRLGVGRIAIVDWDVHHGNGTQEVFWDDPSVLTVSIHQDRCYPTDSGFVTERGAGAGEGTALNVPLVPGSGHEAYLYAFDEIVAPALREYRPELIIVASGFDASSLDPLARTMAEAATFAALTRRVLDIAQEVAGGRVALCQEGGYSPVYAPFCGAAVIAELAGLPPLDDPFTVITEGRGRELEAYQKEWIDSVALELRLLSTLEAKVHPAG